MVDENSKVQSCIQSEFITITPKIWLRRATPLFSVFQSNDLHFQTFVFQVPVQMMYIEEEFESYYDLAINTTVLRLPFNSSSSMLLLLPDDMGQLEDAISPSLVTKWLKWMKSRLK